MEDWTGLVSRDDLKRELSPQAYAEELLSEFETVTDDIRRRLQEFVLKVEEHAQPGDNWWEWLQGTEPLMQRGGLAVVRNGTIVWATMTWIS
jgi:hypothetical protein